MTTELFPNEVTGKKRMALAGLPWHKVAWALGGLLVLAFVLAFILPGGSAAGQIPTFTVTSVAADQTVTIQTANFPANQTFQVTMGAFGTQGVGGTAIGTQASGAGGSFTATYDIPANLHNMDRIAIRLQSAQGYYAYNWFHNSTAGGPTAVPPTATAPGATPPAPTATPGPVYTGFPSFSITAVQKDTSVTIQGSNFPPNQTFQVTMGAYGTQGVGGMPAGTQATGAGGSFTATYNIPGSLIGSARIAIRLQSPQGYYAYNWFHNVTAP
jgi:hypothetical protein